MKTKKKNLKIVAKFFNNYKIINFSNKKKFEAQKKIFIKQCENLGSEVKDAIISGVKEYQGKTLDPSGAFIDDLLENDVDPKVYNKVIDNLAEFKLKWNGNGIEIYPKPLLQSIVGLLTAERINEAPKPVGKRSVEEAKEILKDILRQAHADAKHKSTGSRLKSVFGLQKTSIGMFLDSLLEGYKKSVSKKNYNSEVEELVHLMNKRQDIWDNYQKGGDYPTTFGYVNILMMESLTGEKADKKIKDAAAKEMVEEIQYSGLD